VFDFVNSYYEQVSPIIRTFKGFIVKYMGDGIMAVFPNRADDALQAAITKQRCIAEYNEHRLKKGKKFVDAQVELFKVLARNPTDKVAWHFLVQAAQCLKDGVPET
jgi:class 3 adenylate cyclase